MAKPVRSPLLGYNHNVKYKGRIYHVQTEDSGPANPRLFTHLYFEGTILASKRHEYDALSAEDVVRGLMQGQHKSILKDLKQSLLDEKLTAFFARRSEPFAISDEAAQAIPVAVVDPLSAPLDLDSLPVAIVETPPPEVTRVPLPAGGPGIYVMKKGGDGLVPDHPRAATPHAASPAGSSDGLLPVVVFDPAPTAATPPPIPRAAAAPSPPRFPASAHTPRPQAGAGVVVQRQVVVGAGSPTPPPTTVPGRTPPPRNRRPAPSIPYVVKEGSHTQARPAGPPPRPMVPPPTSAPRTATASYHNSTPQPDVISDKSLDEVILAYLSQGDVKE
jgi:hypothetical protein